LLAIDRAGLVGADGPTHAGSFDLSYLRCIPNIIIMAPSDENECRQMLTTGFKHKGLAAVRYPRGTGTGVPVSPSLTTIEIGKAEIKRTGKKVAILAFGSMLSPSLQAAEMLDATVVNMRFVKPLDTSILQSIASTHDLIITVEENAAMGGAGTAVLEAVQALNLVIPTLTLGLPDLFIEHGIHETMLAECGLNAESIVKSIKKKLSSINLKIN
jgi:1-deoxy-D-xylulose-5-phosphate synthase